MFISRHTYVQDLADAYESGFIEGKEEGFDEGQLVGLTEGTFQQLGVFEDAEATGEATGSCCGNDELCGCSNPESTEEYFSTFSLDDLARAAMEMDLNLADWIDALESDVDESFEEMSLGLTTYFNQLDSVITGLNDRISSLEDIAGRLKATALKKEKVEA